MSKVLLLFEDINELGMVESLLKKLGFDTMSSSNEYSLKEQVLGFNPQLVMIHGRNRRLHTVAVSQKLKLDTQFKGKVVVIVEKGERFASADLATMRVDGILEAPLEPKNLVVAVAKILGIDDKPLWEKYEKFFQSKANARVVSFNDPARAKKYDMIAKQAAFDVNQTVFEKSNLKKAQEEMTKDWDKNQLAEQDRLKREFVQAMFQKADKATKK